MSHYIILLILMLTCLTTFSQQLVSVVPQPVKVQRQNGDFQFTENTKIWIEPGKEMQGLGNLLSETINAHSDLKLSATWKMSREIPKSLVQLETQKEFPTPEGYSIIMKPNLIKITARNGAGIFYGLQTLLQLLPIENKNKSLSIGCVNIDDSPRFNWRGVHLDVCRHFFPVEFIKKYIDMLSMYKMNTFHWHLTDDQGWRIEIKKYPKLTEIGAWRKEVDGKTYGGFYTQDQIKEVVDYAKKHYITVVPEIEMPGHALAALAAHPEYSCTGGPFKVGNFWGVIEDVYCAGNDKTFDFLQDILTEVMNLFPGDIIHIGGDEVPKIRWKECAKCQARIKSENLKDEVELQSYFIRRIEKFINAKGKKIIGWDEILEGGLAPNASVMSWQGIDGGIAAAKSKHNVVMSPSSNCYFDYYQALNNEPKAIGGYTSLEKVYSYEPIPESLTSEESKYILGAQANLWTEYILTTDHVEYMLMPRMIALSEVVWSPKESRDFKSFLGRMTKQYNLLAARNINFRIPSALPDESELLITGKQELKLSRVIPNSEIMYTLDGSEPGLSSSKYFHPINLIENVVVKTKTFLQSGKSSNTSSLLVSIVDSARNGLNYKYYEGLWNKLPNFDSLTSKRSGNILRLKLEEIKPSVESFAVVFDGFINIKTEGSYTFFISSDDGSKLMIGDKVVDNDGAHGTIEVSDHFNLKPGMNPIKVMYFNKWGGQKLKLEYEGPGISRRLIPASSLYLNN